MAQDVNLDQYPSAVISNEEVTMKLFLPDKEKGLYRSTRFDWSGIIGSLTYKGHEYFGLWKDRHDPLNHDDITGPVEGYLEPGLGYAEARPGEGFVRIGIGILEKIEEDRFDFRHTYKVLDYGHWSVDTGDDWISFKHEIYSDFGYAYAYEKTIRLNGNGFSIEHRLSNIGDKPIETDQFNHNFFVIDGDMTGSEFFAEFPFELSTESDLEDMVRLDGNTLRYTRTPIERSIGLDLSGFETDPQDHQVTVTNGKSWAGVSLKMDQPLARLFFWSHPNTVCPENFIDLAVAPGKSMDWTSEYSLFVN